MIERIIFSPENGTGRVAEESKVQSSKLKSKEQKDFTTEEAEDRRGNGGFGNLANVVAA